MIVGLMIYQLKNGLQDVKLLLKALMLNLSFIMIISKKLFFFFFSTGLGNDEKFR